MIQNRQNRCIKTGQFNTVSVQLMYTTLDFLVRLNARRIIVRASLELKFRTANEADTAHVVASYRQLASRDISFFPTLFKSPQSE